MLSTSLGEVVSLRSTIVIMTIVKWHCKVAVQLFDSDTIILATYYYYYYYYYDAQRLPIQIKLGRDFGIRP